MIDLCIHALREEDGAERGDQEATWRPNQRRHDHVDHGGNGDHQEDRRAAEPSMCAGLMRNVAQREGEAEGERAGGEHAEWPKVDEDRDQQITDCHGSGIERRRHGEPEDMLLLHHVTLVHHGARQVMWMMRCVITLPEPIVHLRADQLQRIRAERIHLIGESSHRVDGEGTQLNLFF